MSEKEESIMCIGWNQKPASGQAAYKLLRLGYLPAVKVGDRWTASAFMLTGEQS
jgi:hypothetical protein